MRSINLYTITRQVNKSLMGLYEKSLSNRDNSLKIREDEIEIIRLIVTGIESEKAQDYCLENWFYSFTMPQIGKEFDLLKLGKDNRVVNVEIKSQDVGLERIEKQLKQNRYYLSHISSEIYSFTIVKNEDNTLTVHRYDGDILCSSSIKELVDILNTVDESIEDGIEKLFRPRDYLISPFNTPEKFLEEKYYLNNMQEQIKNRTLETIKKGRGLIGINGSAGTGKTLLLYDIAKALSENFKVGIIHCGSLNEGHNYLNRNLKNISIVSSKSISKDWVDMQDVICVDEAQRLYADIFDLLIELYNAGTLRSCIFSYDYAMMVSIAKKTQNEPRVLSNLPGFIEEHLTERVRTNREIYSFIRNMLKLYDVPKNPVKYEDIDIVYANNLNESERISRYYQKNGYTLISYSFENCDTNDINQYIDYLNENDVIGQEYENVVLVIDENFKYNADGELEELTNSNQDDLITQLLYQNISRTREKLCLVVVNNPDVFDNLFRIKENQMVFERLEEV